MSSCRFGVKACRGQYGERARRLRLGWCGEIHNTQGELQPQQRCPFLQELRVGDNHQLRRPCLLGYHRDDIGPDAGRFAGGERNARDAHAWLT